MHRGQHMIGTAKRDAGLPGERFTFEVAQGTDRAASQVGWTGGGDPATGTGPRFSTVFTAGAHRVTASGGEDEVRFEVTVSHRWSGCHALDPSMVRRSTSRA